MEIEICWNFKLEIHELGSMRQLWDFLKQLLYLAPKLIRTFLNHFKMKPSIFLCLFIGLVAFNKSEIDHAKVLPNQIAYIVNGGELNLATPEKASISAGANMSRIAFKGTECPRKFKVGDKIEFYAREVKTAQFFTFSIVKLEVNEKKRFASYNSLNGNTIKSFPTKSSSIGHPGVFHIALNEPLSPGHYAAVFKSVTKSGNFMISNGYRNNPISFEVLE